MLKLNLLVLRASDMEALAGFYQALGIAFERHRHGNGPEHMGGEIGAVVFEIYPKRSAISGPRQDGSDRLRRLFPIKLSWGVL